MITEKTIQEIRDRISIVELVSEYVPLKRSGQNFMGLCPFHKEKSPSFNVNPQKQIFHCFGCNRGGNIFTFLRDIEGLRFPEAVKKLADKTGVKIEEDKKSFAPTHSQPLEEVSPQILKALEWAAKYFHYLLMETPEYAFAKKYILSRNISERTLKKFQIGASPKGWQTLIQLMTKRGFEFSTLVDAGLAIPKEQNPKEGYDRFRERLMFPIRDPEGHVIGFGARLLSNQESQPKYLNSPESTFFPKRKILYGFHENQRGIRLKGEALLVEGYMDVIGLYDKGIENAVATMGTALTVDHCRFLKQTTRRVVTIFDADRAGIDAWHRSVPIFLSQGIFAKDLTLPDNLDPDEFVAKEGPEKFTELCEKSPRQITKYLKEISSRGQLSEEEKSKILGELVPILAASRRNPDRVLLWDNISLVLGVSQESLKNLAESMPSSKEPIEKAKVQKKSADPVQKPLDPVDLEMLRSVLQAPTRFLATNQEEWSAGLRESSIREYLIQLRAAKDFKDFDRILSSFSQCETDPRILGPMTSRLLSPPTKEDATQLDAIIERLGSRKKQQQIQHLTAQIRLSQKLGNRDEEALLLERLQSLRSPERTQP